MNKDVSIVIVSFPAMLKKSLAMMWKKIACYLKVLKPARTWEAPFKGLGFKHY